MKPNLRRELRSGVPNRELIANIATNTGELAFETAQFGQLRRRIRCQRETRGLRSKTT